MCNYGNYWKKEDLQEVREQLSPYLESETPESSYSLINHQEETT